MPWLATNVASLSLSEVLVAVGVVVVAPVVIEAAVARSTSRLAVKLLVGSCRSAPAIATLQVI